MKLREWRVRLGNMVERAGRGGMCHNVEEFEGRGRKRSLSAAALYEESLAAFERMRAASVKRSPVVLRHI